MGFITAAIGVGWVVSPVITLVINKIESHIEKKYFKNSETGKYLKEMQTSLQEIHVIMVRVEKQRIENRELVQGIKDAIYEAEDVVNEFEYDLLDKEKSVEQSGSSIKSVEQSGSSFIIDKFKLAVMEKGKELSENLDKLDWPILGDKEFKKKVKEVSERLVRAKESAMILLDSIKINNSTNIQSPEQENELDTSSQIDEEIIGRIEERKELIELLFKEENNATPTIIQIVGHGGIGKTTLARLVYNDPRKLTEPRGQDFFELNIWLSVSENFDGIKLTKEMLKYVSPNFTLSDTSFDLLQKELKEKLASKRILLVLDNVWYVKDVNRKSSFEQNWLKFLAPLKKTKPGSKIIVTTREGVVDNTLESFGSLEVMKLGGLNDADSWSLLKIKAFGRKNHHNRHDLEPIGEDLVKNLKGFPLAIRVVGTELRGESKKEEWERILNENALDKSDIMDILLRSYKHLPDYLQPCFAYCSLFPKGYYLKQDRLVHMWIAHGFVHPRKQKSSEEIGKSYFNELIGRSFIQIIKQPYEGSKEYYMMHDLMNDLACHVSHGECHILKEGDTLENLGSIRHLSVTNRELAQLANVRDVDKLRTLIILSVSSYGKVNVADEVFIKMKKIRVLDIDCQLNDIDCQLNKYLSNIGECKLLQYLCFRYCKSGLVPDTFSKLHLLTVLFIRKERKGHRFYSSHLVLPQSICCMSRLKFIDTSKSIKMELGGHVQLHSVWRGGPASFSIQRKEGWDLNHLREFNNIKGSLKIDGLENVASREKAIEAQLGSKKHVTELQLRWGWDSIVESNIERNEILETLRPHPNIKRLDIENYPGDKFPSWLESNWLSRLAYLKLYGLRSGFKMLPALGQLSQLRKLYFTHITTVSRIGDEFYGNGIFPSLEELEIHFLDGLEEWSSPPRGVRSFPKLRRLQLYYCPKLFSLPEMESFCSLKFVRIEICPKVRSLPKLPNSLWNLQVKGLHDLKQFYGNDIFPSLVELYIEDMEGLEEWSSPCGFQSFPKLRRLKLSYCPELFSLPEMESFCSLESVRIEICPKVKSLPKLPVSLRNLQVKGLHDLKQFYGSNIFPSLEELYIDDMEGLEEWSSPCGVQSFSKLRRLELYDCPKLFSLPKLESFCSLESVRIEICPKVRSLPKLPVSLRNLQVKGFHDLKQFYGSNIFPSLEELYIDDMEGLEEWSSPCGVQSFLKLRRLELYDCPKLFSLSKLESFRSLEYVRIEICPKVRSLPKLPVSLRYLDIVKVHPDLEKQFGNKNGPEWDKVATVSGCHCEIFRDGTWEVVQDGSEESEEDFSSSSEW